MRTFGLVALLTVFVAAPGALAAPINHGNLVGTNVTFNNVTETTQTAGDPECLFVADDGNPANGTCAGAPLVSGDQLLFFPTQFNASATGAGGSDSTHSQLTTTVIGNTPLVTIDQIRIDEYGDTVLSGTGTVTTNTAVNISGFVTVLAPSVAVIPFSIANGNVSFVPGNTFDLPTDGGPAKIWTGTVLIDIASVVPNATQVMLSFDNQLDAFSETNSSASITKKVVDGPAIGITIIPEPATGSLLGIGLLGLLLLNRRGSQ